MGLGNITREILNRIPQDAKLYSFEVKEDFCKKVKESLHDDRLIIINDGAENIRKHVNEEVDNMVSSMPFTFFSKEKTDLIFKESKAMLKSGGHFSQILYSKIHYKKFSSAFDECEMIKTNNFPLGFIYHCLKK